MPKFLALTSMGLGQVVKQELDELGFKSLKASQSSAEFDGSWAECYRANMQLSTATRIVLPVLDFPAYDYDELYYNLLRKHDFTKYIEPHQTLSIDATTSDPALSDQRMVAMKAKDALVDQFRNKFKERPSVDSKNPDLKVLVKIVKSQVSVSIDTTGRPLSFRGYREEQGDAPLREHVAAALLKWANWDVTKPLVDPMCGSGTFLIEAALSKLKSSPQFSDRHYAFQNLKNFKADVFDALKKDIFKAKSDLPAIRILGFDQDPSVIEKARRNAQRAGVTEFIKFSATPLSQLRLPEEQGFIVTNPPYGERLEDLDRVKDLYADIGYTFKKVAPEWDVWILSGQSELTKNLRMKADQKYPVMNGPIECRWVHYKILPPKKV